MVSEQLNRIEAKLDQVIAALVGLIEAMQERDEAGGDMESGGLDVAPPSL